jgi:uncharacterized membrane protein YphA (DoxX/SURF4 family)
MDFPVDARTALQWLCGLAFLPHTIAKLSNISKAAALFDRVGFRPPRFFVVFTSVMELLATIGFVSGLYVEIAALIAATVLFGAAWAIATIHGPRWRWHHPGIEYPIVWGTACLFAGLLP